MYGQAEKSSVIAFDFDQTISADPELFLRVMKTFELCGWVAIVVTYRHASEWPEDLQFLVDKGYRVFYTGRLAKREFMAAKGWDIAVWVDDSPETIVMNMDQMTGRFFLPGSNQLLEV